MVELVAATVARMGAQTVVGSQMVTYAEEEIEEGMEEGEEGETEEGAEEDVEGVDVEEVVGGDAVSVLPCSDSVLGAELLSKQVAVRFSYTAKCYSVVDDLAFPLPTTTPFQARFLSSSG